MLTARVVYYSPEGIVGDFDKDVGNLMKQYGLTFWASGINLADGKRELCYEAARTREVGYIVGTNHKMEGNKMLSASEAIWGFVGWLSSRSEVVTLSAKHEVPPVVDLVVEFCKANNLPEPRDGWAENLVHPE